MIYRGTPGAVVMIGTHARFAIAVLIICSAAILWTKDNTDADVVRPRLTFGVVHLKPVPHVNPVY